MMRPQSVRVVTAVAHGVAVGLGLGGMPWLGIYVIGRDLARRVVGRLTVARALNNPATAGSGAGLSWAIRPGGNDRPAT